MNTREYLIIIEDQASSPSYDLAASYPCPMPLSNQRVVSFSHYWRKRDEGREVEGANGEKAWSSIIDQLLSAAYRPVMGHGERGPARMTTTHTGQWSSRFACLSFLYSVYAAPSELSRGSPELVQHFIGGVHISVRALHVLNLIWFG